MNELQSENTTFLFDAMLMYSWVADSRFHVCQVNLSLREWLKDNGQTSVIEAIDSSDGLALREFFKAVVDLDGDILDAILNRLVDIGKVINLDTIPEDEPYRYGDVEIKREHRIANTKLIAGVRAMNIGGFPMTSINVEDRVDLITVCHIEGVPGSWRITGYQGQLQSAWLRIEPIVKEGTRSGTVALMARNLSHNIGSHALYWLEQDSRADKPQSRFYKYLRERMELIAGFATAMPLSPCVVDFGLLVSQFKNNTVLLDRLTKTEGVTKIVITPEHENQPVAIPGGTVGRQAFYAILENIIRDHTKYGFRASEAHISIRAEELGGEIGNDYLKVIITSDPTIDVDRALEHIDEILDSLRIADEGGHLIEGGWGIKERFIAAAVLRGIKVEDLGFTRNHGDWSLGRREHDGLPILKASCIGRAVAWEFYLLKPKEVLVISSQHQAAPSHNHIVTIRDMSWLKANVDSPSRIRHRFIVLIPQDEEDLLWIKERRHRFPFRTFIGGRTSDPPKSYPSDFAPLDEEVLRRGLFSPEELYQSWLKWLCPEVARGYLLFAQGPGSQFKFQLAWNAVKRHAMFSDQEFESLARGQGCVALFDRHWICVNMISKADGRRLHYEPYGGDDPIQYLIEEDPLPPNAAFALFEAALIKILIIDERLDVATLASVKDPHAQGCSIKDRFAFNGITIKGAEFSAEQIPDKTLLMDWARQHAYHFICIHRGILEKLKKHKGHHIDDVTAELKQHALNVVIHSGKVGSTNIPGGMNFMPLSNILDWANSYCGKMDIVHELCLVRRV